MHCVSWRLPSRQASPPSGRRGGRDHFGAQGRNVAETAMTRRISSTNIRIVMKYLCPNCQIPLTHSGDKMVCEECGVSHASIVDGIVHFDGCFDKMSFFEKQAVERLGGFYEGYTAETFEQVLSKVFLWQMDWANKRVGIARKFWWEPNIGKIQNKKIMEIGCGVNYLVPYFLLSNNDVFAFDICRESVLFLKSVVERVCFEHDRLTLAVADATEIELGEKFDVIDISNVLHHIEDKPAVLERAHRFLSDDGKLIIVEPNYYYPPRWIIETEAFDPFNVVKNYFVRNDLIEKGEKAIVFPKLCQQIEDSGFKIENIFPDENYLGYFTQYWMKEDTALTKIIFSLDKNFFRHVMPIKIAPFQYIIASKI